MINKIFRILKNKVKIFVKRSGKEHFIHQALANSKILDVGCGNNGATKFKSINERIYYVGIDIQDYYFDSTDADEYILIDKNEFNKKVASIKDINYVVCAHNLEHVEEPVELINAICTCLEKNGKLFLSFPSKNSINFPSRAGTLNYYDDKTHNITIPDLDIILNLLKDNGLHIDKVYCAYQPKFMWLLGFLMEPFSKIKKRVLPGTWAYYGFETVIWATKLTDE